MLRMFCVAASLALALIGNQARADSFTPTSTTFHFSGFVDVDFNINLSCRLDIEVRTNASGTNATVTDASFEQFGLCSLLSFSNFNYDIDVASPLFTGMTATELRINDVEIMTTFSSCGPTSIYVNWYQGTNEIWLVSESLSGSPSCTISGTLNQWSGPPLTITY